MTKINVMRNGMITEVSPKKLTNEELCHVLSYVRVDGGNWMPETEERDGYAAIREAIRRLKEMK